MNILYGVNGEGMGHAIRSAVIIWHLKMLGHKVVATSSGKAAHLLSRECEVIRIPSLLLAYDDAGINYQKTAWLNIRRFASLHVQAIKALDIGTALFRPDVVITDFEHFTYFYGRRRGIPVVSIDNQHAISRCKLAKEAVSSDPVAFRVAKLVTELIMPRCAHYIVTTFFNAPLLDKYKYGNTTTVPAVLRPSFIGVGDTTSHSGPIVVYQRQFGSVPHAGNEEQLCWILNSAPGQRFIVYGRGIRRSCSSNIVFKDFNSSEIVRDLILAKAVICNGGMTLISEALHLGKPVLSIPIQGQFEQMLNAAYVEILKCGRQAPSLNVRVLNEFIADIPDHTNQCRLLPKQNDNTILFAVLEGLLPNARSRVT
jgi:uncharacterized protein (TIGR00661 family)